MPIDGDLKHANLNSSVLDRNFIDYLSGDEMNSKDAQDCSKLGSHPPGNFTALLLRILNIDTKASEGNSRKQIQVLTML